MGPMAPAAGAAYVVVRLGTALPGGLPKPSGGGGTGGAKATSTCGSVKPHFAQKRAPSGPISPQ